MTLHVLVGLPGAGKSTWAQDLDAIVVSSDAIRKRVTGDERDLSSDETVWHLFYEQVRINLGAGHDVIADATGLRKAHRERLIAIARTNHAKAVAWVWINIPEAFNRNARRERPVDHDVMMRFARELAGVVNESIDGEGFDAVVRVCRQSAGTETTLRLWVEGAINEERK
jgi:predicted kinase